MTLAIAKSCGPGRPKDLEKRAAILEAAKRLFPQSGFEGTSMDVIAAEAGVSKLTVYSHFTDKETLFFAAIRARCEEQMPATLFDVDLKGPVRHQLEAIARAFFSLVMAPESISLHRVLTSGTGTSPKLVQMFWDAGPKRVQGHFQQFLHNEVEAGQLEIADIPRASAQFFALLKGEFHARLLCGCSEPISEHDIERHVRATVEFFLRAYAPCPGRVSPVRL
ncbi:TetR/AcrR family transcriptional regulator [Dokdonella soli]|uniref:TetR/AcrR family transcriptional regulator n=1 Tax=Dokdonella soli TaxID=529810 RepID=A0ABP3TVW6_9GAMM